LLPAPFGPMMPSASPRRSWKLRFCTAQKSLAFVRGAPGWRRNVLRKRAGSRSRKLVCCSPRRNRFQTRSTSTQTSDMAPPKPPHPPAPSPTQGRGGTRKEERSQKVFLVCLLSCVLTPPLPFVGEGVGG